VDPRTRHQLKQDEFRDTIEHFEQFFKVKFKEIVTTTVIVIVVLGLAGGLKYYLDKQETEANVELAAALKTVRAYVGAPVQGMNPDTEAFPTAQAKYKKALEQFNAIVQRYHTFPRPKAVGIALYQAGICEALLGEQAVALRTLQEASRDSDREIASLAKFALAGELIKAGKLQEGVKVYQELADHSTLSVPRAAALLAMADAYRSTQPVQARKVYEQLQKEFGSDTTVAQAVKQQMAGLPQ
jgi:tetratricopeptide (TPR) repeat protein